MFEILKDPTKIQIMGTGNGNELAPIETERVIYCLNDYINVQKFGVKPDLLFIMDVLDEKPQIVAGHDNLGEVVQKINDMGVPLIAPFQYEEIPKSVAFPLEKAVQEFGQPYFTNTIAYMICYALMAGAKEIHLYGINQASSSEYFYEKAGVEYWLGIANGRGVEITINGERSELLTNKARFGGGIMYGYNSTFKDFLESKKKFGVQMVKQLSAPAMPISRTVRKITHVK